MATGSNKYGQCNTEDWTNIVAVSVGECHTVGLKADGTVVAVGLNESGQCNVSEWTNIVAVEAGSFHTVGLKEDGTVVAAGSNKSGQSQVTDWKLFNNIDTIHQEWMSAKENEYAELKKELANLKGLFSGKRRTEIETRMAELE